MIEANVTPEFADLSYYLSYKEPLLNMGSERTKHSMIKKILKSFEINLNNIKFFNDSPADKFISFHKFYNETLIETSIGLQELSVKISRFDNEEQVVALLNSVVNAVKDISGFRIDKQRFALAQHYSMIEDVGEYLKSLNPETPPEFSEYVTSQGVTYKLSYDENFNVSLLVDTSLAIPNGIFINADLFFFSEDTTFQRTMRIAREKYKEITGALGLIEI